MDDLPNLKVNCKKATSKDQFHFYRFSVSWPRVLKDGFVLNPKGVEYYNKLIDLLIKNHIEPIITMYHFDLPQAIQDLGGFMNPLIAEYFSHFADILFENFGDRVKQWVTFNEPYQFCHYGYGTGEFAPGVKAPGVGEYLCGHHVLEAHAKVYHLYKRKYFSKQQGQIGISLNSRFFYPNDESVGKSLTDEAQEFNLGWFANAIFSENGDYPKAMIEKIGNNSAKEGRNWSRLPKFSEKVRKDLIGSADFLGLNYYTSRLIAPKLNDTEETSFDNDLGVNFFVDDSWTRGKSSWLYSVPRGLQDLLKWIKVKYNNPKVIITENGFSDAGELGDDGRIEYLETHLTAVASAVSAGSNITGYTVWSLIDNFEWLSGFTERFGIYGVNFESERKERTKKKSAEFVEKLINDHK